MRQHTTDREHRQRLLVFAAIAALHLIGFGLLIAVVAPQHLALAGGGVFGISLGLTAWALGARHAFDADHIAAIDNSTRKLMNDGRDGLPAGFFFSIGHSTIVVALGAIVAVGASGLAGALQDDSSALHVLTGAWGPLMAGSFLLAIGALNLAVMRKLAATGRRLRAGEISDAEFEAELESRGLMNRFYRRFTRAVSAPWQMYPIGMLFGFGFDTATEVALLVLAGGAAATGLPFYAVMTLPILFAAGMTLFDTLNSSLMSRAYGWALENPARKVRYNLATTGVTAISALAIGAMTLAGIDLANAGYVLVALLSAIWVAALARSRFTQPQRP